MQRPVASACWGPKNRRPSRLALHPELAKRIRIEIFFCDPHSPWQRGSNEICNGLIREYLPKGMDLSNITQADLTRIGVALNSRPRKMFGLRTPAEVFAFHQLN